MRKPSALWTGLILGFMICWAAAAYAQDAAQAKSTTEAKTEKPVHPYRVDFSLNEMEDGKKINTRQYSLNVNAEDANELKIGTKVPVEVKSGEIQYIDIGTNVWCRIGEGSDGIALSVRAENSNIANPEPASGRDTLPTIRQLQIKASTLAQLGKPMIVGSVDDPSSKRQFQLEATVTRLK